MLYHLFKYFDNVHNLPGAGMFQYISFRAAAAIIIALLIVIVFGRNIINFLRRKQIGEEIRDLGLEGQLQKKGTPTMGGVIILLAILIPVLLFGQLDNVYIQLMLVSTIWLGLIGFLDDYIKVFRHHKEGLKGRFKIVGQVGLGIIVGTTMCFSPDIVVREKTTEPVETIYLDEHGRTIADHIQRRIVSSESRQTTQTTIPFVKDNEFDYSWLTGGNRTLTWILYVVVAILVVTAVSNGANLTDGLDGLVTGVSAPIVLVLGILAYLSGHIVYADYLNIMYIPGSGELVVFAAALAGALVGFLWYNSFPAQIFMGDTGSLSIGGIIAVAAGSGLISDIGEIIGYGWYSYMAEYMLSECGFLAGGIAMFAAGQRMKRRSARIARYLAVMGERGYISVEELCTVTGKSRKKIESDLDYMVEKGLLGTGAYLDSGRGIFFRSADAFADYANAAAKKENVTPKEANEGYAGALRAIRSANDRIADPVLSEKIDHLETVAGKIFREVEEHPEKQQQAATFLNYYLPTTLKLLDSYAKFEEAGIEGENLSRAQERIEETMDALIKGFDKQLDDLYRNEAMDIDSDIRVMENMLRRDTASVEDDFGLGGAAVQRAPDEE